MGYYGLILKHSTLGGAALSFFTGLGPFAPTPSLNRQSRSDPEMEGITI